jgi:hypothetical protein
MVRTMPIITHIEYHGLSLTPKNGLVVIVRGDTPPGDARAQTHERRRQFWEKGKRLPVEGLVAIVSKETHMPPTVSLALLTTREQAA